MVYFAAGLRFLDRREHLALFASSSTQRKPSSKQKKSKTERRRKVMTRFFNSSDRSWLRPGRRVVARWPALAGALILGVMTWSCLALVAAGQTPVTIFGPRRYDRQPGPPRNVTEQFTAQLGGTLLNYDLQIQNGAPDGSG